MQQGLVEVCTMLLVDIKIHLLHAANNESWNGTAWTEVADLNDCKKSDLVDAGVIQYSCTVQ